MSASTTSYANLLDGMWAPEGSEINDRLKRLQELEQMRKDREAKRQELLKSRGQQTTGVITRTARVKTTTVDPESSVKTSIRRALSLRDDPEDKENYGGARPKVGSGNGQEEPEGWNGLFSNVKTSIIAPRPTLGSERSRSRFDSSDSEEGQSAGTRSQFTLSGTYERPSYTDRTYSRGTTGNDTGGSLFSSVTQAYVKPRTTTYERKKYGDGETGGFKLNDGFFKLSGYSSRVEPTEEQPQYEVDQEMDNGEDYNQNGQQAVEEESVDDEGEEPLHFIERLKNGKNTKHTGYSFHSNGHNNFAIGSIPAVPPLSELNTVDETDHADLPNLEQPGSPTRESVIFVQENENAVFAPKNPYTPKVNTFMNKSKSPSTASNIKNSVVSSTPYTNGNNENNQMKMSMSYEIHEVEYDSEDEEEGKTLPFRESMFAPDASQWDFQDHDQEDLDKMQEFFSGQHVDDDPNISRELDGEKVKAVLDRSIVTPAKSSRNDNASEKTSTKKVKPQTPKKPKMPVDKIKYGTEVRSSGSENDSRPASENEGKTTPRKSPRTPRSERSRSVSEKLAKLEAPGTPEKVRKQSAGEGEIKRSVPSYMSGTSSSKRKTSQTKDQSPKPTDRDLKRDVRELKQFVHDNSAPNSPATSPVKLEFGQVTSAFKPTKTSTREISVQTDDLITTDTVYVCKHCGKSSAEEVCHILTAENLKKTFGRKNSSPANVEKAKTVEPKFSSRDSVKSAGELSTKSDKTHSKPRPATGGYMKGTTASRLKVSGPSLADGKNKLSPEMMLYAGDDTEQAKPKGSLKGAVKERSKTFENTNKAKSNKPALSLFRGNSAERARHDLTSEHTKSKLSKSKSVEQVHLLRKLTATKSVPPCNVQKKTKAPAVISIKSVPTKQGTGKPKSPSNSQSRSLPVSPKSASKRDGHGDTIESEVQFTTIVNNPFIKNDPLSPRAQHNNESVWEKANSKSRDSSLKRSKSMKEGSKSSKEPASPRSTTSAGSGKGERASLSHLSWSDSGSTGSLNKSRSDSHGSQSSLNDKAVFDQPRSRTISTSSQSSVLNLLTPVGTKRNSVTGAMETDVDADCNSGVRENGTVIEHNEDTVNRAHLEFAKNACHLLDAEIKKRDSSNENNNTQVVVNGNKAPEVNGANIEETIEQPKQNGSAKNKKGKKGFLKGKKIRK